MNTVTQTPMDENLLIQLREMACHGKQTKDLVAHIEQHLKLPPHNMVPVLGYLCRAFSVPLPVILPLREDEGKGPFGRAIDVIFWFAALIRNGLTVVSWNWDNFWQAFGGNFDENEMRTKITRRGCIRFVEPPHQPGDVYTRGVFEVYVDKVKAFGPDSNSVFQDLKEFVEKFHNTTKASCDNPLQLGLDLQVEDQGPKLHVACMAQAMRYTRITESAPA